MIDVREHGIGLSEQPHNNLIDKYVISEDGNITVGDVCEFVNGQIKKTAKVAKTFNDTVVRSVTTRLSGIVALDTSRIFIEYIDTTTVYAAVISLDSDYNMTLGTPVSVATSASTSSGTVNNVRLLSTDKVVMCYDRSSYRTCVAICNISGTDVTVANTTTVDSDGWGIVVTALTSSLVTFGYTTGASGTLSAKLRAATIASDAFTLGTALAWNSYGNVANEISTISSTAFMAVYSDNNTNALYVKIGTVSGTTITGGTAKACGDTTGAGALRMALISTSQMLLECDNYVQIIGISGTTATVNTKVQIYTSGITMSQLFLISSTLAIMFFAGASVLKAKLMSISGTTITAGSESQVSSNNPFEIIMCVQDASNKQLMLGYNIISEGYYQRMMLRRYDTSGNLYDTSNAVDQKPQVIAMQSGNSGDTIKVGVKGIVKGFSGLTPATKYYCADDGTLTTSSNWYPVGIAISSTEMVMLDGFWE